MVRHPEPRFGLTVKGSGRLILWHDPEKPCGLVRDLKEWGGVSRDAVSRKVVFESRLWRAPWYSMVPQRGSPPVAQAVGLALRASERDLCAGRLLGDEESAR